METSGFFALAARLKYINRWGLMRSARPENVQEHSHMTALLAYALAAVRRDVLGLPADPERAAAAALLHDASEIFTGDLPTPVKYHSPEIRAAYGDVEALAEKKLLAMLPEELRGSFSPLLGGADAETERLVKAADKLSAYLKCVEERQAGNAEFALAEKQTLEAVKKLAMPEADYFIEHFAPAFALTLDELDFKV